MLEFDKRANVTKNNKPVERDKTVHLKEFREPGPQKN